MNYFDFCIKVKNNKIMFGHLKAESGDIAKQILVKYCTDLKLDLYDDKNLSTISLKGHTTKGFQVNQF